jgi:hypothetical protein
VGEWPAEEDRRERRRKLGLPEELTPEEKAAEQAKLAEAAKAKASRALPVKPVSLASQLRDVLVRSLTAPFARAQGLLPGPFSDPSSGAGPCSPLLCCTSTLACSSIRLTRDVGSRWA